MTTFWIIVVIAAIFGVVVAVIYNRLVKSRQMVSEAWSGIDVQLKRRTDLIPNLVETVKGYVGHERETLERVTELRNQAQNMPRDDVAGRAQVEGLLSQALGRLLAVAEAYPDLKASTNFSELQRALQEVEDALQMARRYYNGAVRNLNILVEQFPSNLVANQFGFTQAEYFEIEDATERTLPKVAF
jgi:LemA protein